MPVWVDTGVVTAIHDAQIREHGGLPGLRDGNGLETAMHAPRMREAYGDDDIFELAATYAFGIARDHPFDDGNKRVSFVVTELFLELNGYELACSDAEAVENWLAIAAGSLSAGEIADWLREKSTAL